MKNNFTHLHVHTEYSLLDGSSKIKDLVKQTKELGMDSIAITDHGVMFGVIDFYKACVAEDVKPIIGCEVYVAERTRFDKDAQKDGIYYHLVLLAENNKGYENLMKIVSAGFTEGFYYKPRIDLDLLERYHEGIIGLSACLGGVVAKRLMNVSYDKAKEVALTYNRILGQGNFYLELQDHGLEKQTHVNQELIKMSHETGIPLVATNDIHYTLKEDAQAHDILLCIQTNRKVHEENRMRYPGANFYLKSPEEMQELFQYVPTAIENTYKIAERCNVSFTFHELKLPQYDVPEGYTPKAYLRKICQEGLEDRFSEVTDEHQQRLDYELQVIEDMGYVDYFLIVWDFIKYAKDNDILVGPGRGSAAGSLVSYALKITNVNPLKYQLIFERFLNPERVSMPDIDIDFCYERRQEVIDYVIRKYGADRVAQIITFGTMAARAVIRDVGRALDLPYGDVDKIAKMIPTELGITIKRALKINPELRQTYEVDEEVKHLIDMSMKLEGLPRHSSTHAAGVVISQRPVVDYVPLNSSDGSVTTQFPMTTLEELGLLKMDFLGLRTLTVINNAVNIIKETTGVFIDIETIDYQDNKVYEMIGAGKTDGVFQLESAGMKSFMKELKPENIEDIIAGISLYRPGPMDFIPKYVKGKNHPDQIKYTSDALEPILKTTYGCIVYQEQVMQIVRDLAGYTLGRSDLVRRAMSKKKADVMARERYNFVYGNEEENVPGCVSKNIPTAVAEEIFDEMTDFAKYAFNKSHAAAYAVISYETAYLKAYYSVEFMAALLTSIMDNSTKVAEYINTCKHLGIDVLAPDVNEGFLGFSVTNGKIRYGLGAIKNVGRSAIASLVRERNKNGIYLNLTDFCERLDTRDINKRCIESLIKSGAFDSFEGTRKQYMHVFKIITEGIAQTRKRTIEGQVNLFSLTEEEQPKEHLPDIGEYEKEVLLTLEKEVLGIYLSGHPIEEDEKLWKEHVTAKTTDFYLLEEGDVIEGNQGLYRVADGQTVVIGGMISAKSIKSTRNNQMMAFITIEDMFGEVEVIVFPKDFQRHQSVINEDSKVFVRGRVSIQEDANAKLICQNILEFDEVEDGSQQQTLWVKMNNLKQWNELKDIVVKHIKDNRGRSEIKIFLSEEKQVLRAGDALTVSITEKLLKNLKELLGNDNIITK